MPTLYPTALDNLTNPTGATSQTGTPAVPRTHSQQHTDLNDAVEALQSALGTTGQDGKPINLRAELASTVAGYGAALVGFKQADAGAAARDALEKLREIEVSVIDWITDPTVRAAVRAGTNTADLLPYVQLARAFLETASDGRGGVLKFPRGSHKLNGALDFTCNTGLLHSITVQGDGVLGTVLDFAGAPAGTDGITFGKGAHFALKDIAVANAKRHGVVIGRGTSVGGPDYASFFEVDNVRVQGCGQDGFYLQNCYLGTMRRCWGKANGRNGFTLAGFHTSINVTTCEASENTAAGWSINGLTYAHFESCGADQNGTQGWACTNLQGVVFTACGSEGNQRDGWLFTTSDASAAGLNTQTSDIRGVEMVGCYGLANSKASAGTYATFVGINTANSRKASVAIRGGVAHPNAAGDKAFILAGTSGAITLVKDGFDDTAFTTADSTSGTVEVQNRLMAGRRCLLQTTGLKSVADGGADTTLDVLNTTPVANDLGATVSTSTITIPRGVNKVVVSAGVGWENDGSTGQRTVKVFKNGAGYPGMPSEQKSAVGFTLSNIKSAPVSVAAGDTFSLVVSQTSGAARNTLGTSNSVWLCVEAVS